ncbi:MAG TPA: bacillithiol biosynthesis cysteine-adding enzyme BshC [Gemmatimonadaceae bacterium]|nr:bacillithiol biosynthesis cysteine-adding enzyme BshC [Gemmatimonadaceae bacterium]
MKLRVISTPLRGKDLTAAALAEKTPAGWYLDRPHGAEQWTARAKEVASRFSNDWLTPLLPAIEPTGLAAENLQKAARGGFVVTTGQQPALFGGPLYTWWKAISVAAFAASLSDKLEMPVAPVFWAATDDSDFVEAASTVIATPDGAQIISLQNRDDQGLPLSQIPLGDVSSQLELLRGATRSAPHPRILDVVARTYQAGETMGSAYVKLLREMLSGLGVAVLDSSHPAVRKQGEPLMHRALERASDIESRLFDRDAELKAHAFNAQVQTVRGRSLVFSTTDGKRGRVPISHATDNAVKSSELSPNVLLRPILEKTILPTVAYIGGPAEIAYFAQVSAVANALEIEPPLVLPRWSGIVIEPRIERILEKYSLTPSDFADPHAVETRIAHESLPEDIKTSIAELRENSGKQIDSLGTADKENLISAQVIEGLKRNILHRVDRVERRYAAAIKRKGNDALRDIAAARGALYPLGKPQERALNIVPLWARYGDDLLDSVWGEALFHTSILW